MSVGEHDGRTYSKIGYCQHEELSILNSTISNNNIPEVELNLFIMKSGCSPSKFEVTGPK